MSSEKIGWVKSGKTNQSVEVSWNSQNLEVYIGWAGWTYIGKANSAKEAMNKAEAYLYNK